VTETGGRRPFNLQRWPSVARIGGALVAYVLVEWFGTMVYNFRVVGIAHTIGLVSGTALMTLWALIIGQRILTSSPPAWLRELLEDGEFVVGFVVLDLIVLNIFGPFFMPLAVVWPGGSILLLALSFVGRISAHVLFGVFVVVTTALAWLTVIRAARRLIAPSAAVLRAQRTFRVAAVSSLALYGIYATVLSFNGSLGTLQTVDYRREVVASRTVNTPLTAPLSWLDLRAPDGTLERVTLIEGKDGIRASVDPGAPVVVSVRKGYFGISWIERVALDAGRQAEQLVEAAPSAAIPRRTLIMAYLSEARAREVVEHTRAYLHYYPRDIGFAGAVAAALRTAGDVPSALAVEQLAREATSRGPLTAAAADDTAAPERD
jgi:hypothetical protein